MQDLTSKPPPPQEPRSTSPWRGGRWLSRRFASAWSRGGLALLLLCLVVYVPGQVSLPPIDRDESRFAQASRQMAESGTLEGWTVPRIQDRPRLSKPPLIYWLQAASARLLGDEGRTHEGIWVYRLPSLLAAIATVLLTWRLGISMFDPRPAWLAAAMLAVSPVFAWEAHQARADQVLVFTVVATQYALWRIVRTRHERSGSSSLLASRAAIPILFWLALAAGVLTKGPVTPMIAALTALALCIISRRTRWLLGLRPILGLVILTATVAPWVYVASESVGWREYLSTVYEETIGRAAGAKEGHWGPPGYHLVLLPVLFWPGSLLTAAAVVAAIRLARRSAAGPPASSSSPHLFLLAWLLPSWIVFEVVSTKLPHYTMPLYPAIALLSARAVYDLARSPAHRGMAYWFGFAVWAAVGFVLTVLLPFVGFGGTDPTDDAVSVARVLAALAVGCFGFAAIAVARHTKMIVRTHVAAIFAGALAAAWVCGGALPQLRGFWLSPALAAQLRALDPPGDRPIGLVDYHEDSMLFLTRGRAQRLEPGDDSLAAAAVWLDEHPDGLVVLRREHRDRRDPPGLRIIGGAAGTVYSKGPHGTHLVIVERADRPRRWGAGR